jgi:hypothetical protein
MTHYGTVFRVTGTKYKSRPGLKQWFGLSLIQRAESMPVLIIQDPRWVSKSKK